MQFGPGRSIIISVHRQAKSLTSAGGTLDYVLSGWGRSSVGRAPEWHSGGQGFEPPRLHHPETCMRTCGDVVRNGEIHRNRLKDAEYQALTHRNGPSRMSGFAAGVRFRSSKHDPHLRPCYQGLELQNSETGQNHRRFGGVEPGTCFHYAANWPVEVACRVF